MWHYSRMIFWFPWWTMYWQTAIKDVIGCLLHTIWPIFSSLLIFCCYFICLKVREISQQNTRNSKNIGHIVHRTIWKLLLKCFIKCLFFAWNRSLNPFMHFEKWPFTSGVHTTEFSQDVWPYPNIFREKANVTFHHILRNWRNVCMYVFLYCPFS